MKKKFTVLLISLILVSSVGVIMPKLAGQEPEPTTIPLVEDCGCHQTQDPILPSTNGCYVMNNPIDCTRLQVTKPATRLKDIPAEFSWKDHNSTDWTTPAKNQGNCGSCWDFAAMGALESRIKISENCASLQPDLSEQYVLSCLPAAANHYGQGCLGGDPYNAYYYIMNTTAEGNNANGIIPESCFPYQASHTIPCSDKCPDWMDELIPLTGCNYSFFDLGYATEENTNIIKSILYEHGPIAVALNVTNDFINFWMVHHSSESYYPDTHEAWGNQLNHIVVLVGWKDDSSIPNGGYWIVKNSWGPIWGYDGFFNLEYYALYFGMYFATADYDPSSVNWAPIVDAGGLYHGVVNETVTFDGTGSIDPDGDSMTYAWDFGDNTTGQGPTPTHSYSAQGTYGVTLTVMDTTGHIGTDSGLVGVGEEPLLIDATGNLGIDITVKNTVDYEVTNLDWVVNISGHVLPRITNGSIPQLSYQQKYTYHIPVIGLGFGTLTITVENIQRTEKFFVIGPFVFGLRMQ
jgi:C1A family cysteine protease